MGRRRGSPELCFAVEQRRSWPKSALRAGISSRLWVREDPRIMRDPTGHSGEGARARDAMRDGGGVTLR